MPSGYIQTGGGPNGIAGNTYYTINATAGQQLFRLQLRRLSDPHLPAHQRHLQGDHAERLLPRRCRDLAGNTQQGDTVTVTFTVTAG